MSNRYIKVLILIFISFLFTSCSTTKDETKKIKIVTSNWIGYAPLLYAYEKGKLDSLNIELIVTNSLQFSAQMFMKNDYDGLCSTQVEYQQVNKKYKKSQHIYPIAIFNRSYGGDVILSSISKDEYYSNSYKNIDVYMEEGGVNEILFKSLKNLKEENTNFNRININQYNLSNLKLNKTNENIKMIITYEPHASKLKNSGFKVIESTKSDKLLVFDFLSLKEGLLSKKEINILQNIINESIDKFKNNPKEIFDTVGFYFDGLTYDDFSSSIGQIQLFNKDRKINFIKLIEDKKIIEHTKYLKEQ